MTFESLPKKEELNKIILEAINLQIDLVLDLDKKIDSIVCLEEINYDMEILKYDNYLNQYKIDKEIINDKISSINKNNLKNKSWINKFKEYNHIKKINKTVINELIEDV